jgi:hypothetical protein
LFELREDKRFNEVGEEFLHDGADVIPRPWADEPVNEEPGESRKEQRPEKRTNNDTHSSRVRSHAMEKGRCCSAPG